VIIQVVVVGLVRLTGPTRSLILQAVLASLVLLAVLVQSLAEDPIQSLAEGLIQSLAKGLIQSLTEGLFQSPIQSLVLEKDIRNITEIQSITGKIFYH
jgi:hypothetical protein